jgi:hypothetical protein
MATILDKYEKEKPLTARVNTVGGDPEPIGSENSFSPSLDLSKNESRLQRARGGILNTRPYSDTVTNK